MSGHRENGKLIESLLEYLRDLDVDERLFPGGGAMNSERGEQKSKQEGNAGEIIEFMDEIPGGFLIYRADGDEEIIHANKALLKIFGCSTLKQFREWTKNSFRGLVYPSDLEEVEKSIARQIAENSDYLDYVEYRIRRRDGAIRYIEDYGRFLESRALGGIFYVFLTDVTDEVNRRKKDSELLLHEKQRKLDTLIEEYDKERKLIGREHLRRLEIIEGLSVNYDTILYVDVDADKVLPYRVSHRSEGGFEEMYRPHDFRSYVKNYSKNWVLPEDRANFERVLDHNYIRANLMDVKSYFANYRIVEDGETRHMQLLVVNVGSDKHVSQAVIGARNIEEEIRREMHRSKELEEALGNAKLANIAKNTFLSNMSHDMRTPLNAIFGFTALARNCVDEPAKVYLDKIDASGKQLLDLIDKVLEISQIESHETFLNEEECDLNALLQKVQMSFKTLSDDKEQRLTLDTSAVEHRTVICDRYKVQQILTHIVSNAIKYTNNGGKVEIIAEEKHWKSDGTAEFSFAVKDNGIGIGEKSLERIFDPFERVRNTTFSGVYGMGLGLTIAKRYADAMNGTIRVESKLGRGSTFTLAVRLRVREEAAEEKEDGGDEVVEKFKGKKILLVDDNDINLEIEEELLEEAGFEVDTLSDGSFAVEVMKSEKAEEYALILMDIQMPIMDGREATKLIRELPAPAGNIPIVALSANAYERDRKLSLECGMDEHLTKPVDIPLLLKTVAGILKARENRR